MEPVCPEGLVAYRVQEPSLAHILVTCTHITPSLKLSLNITLTLMTAPSKWSDPEQSLVCVALLSCMYDLLTVLDLIILILTGEESSD